MLTTMQIKINEANGTSDGAYPVDARIGDFDLKSSKTGKGEYWKSVERELTDGGWYFGKGASQVGAEPCTIP